VTGKHGPKKKRKKTQSSTESSSEEKPKRLSPEEKQKDSKQVARESKMIEAKVADANTNTSNATATATSTGTAESTTSTSIDGHTANAPLRERLTFSQVFMLHLRANVVRKVLVISTWRCFVVVYIPGRIRYGDGIKNAVCRWERGPK